MKPARVLLDVDTQFDFFWPEGSRYCPAASHVGGNIRRLFNWAWEMQIPVISTVLRIRPSESWLHGEVPYCLEDTEGERKMPGTLLPRYVDLGVRNVTDLPVGLFRRYQQVIFEKRVSDVFSHAGLERLITELRSAAFVVCGAVLTGGILQAALGLRHRGSHVILAADAVLDLDEESAEMACRRLEAKGVVFLPTGEIIASKHVQQVARFGRPEAGLKPPAAQPAKLTV